LGPEGNIYKLIYFIFILIKKNILDSAYKDGIFEVKIRLDENYPLTAPKMNFVTKIFHPNIHFETGEICIEVLKD